MNSSIATFKQKELVKPSDEQALEAVATLISWIGDDPNREGVEATPKRVLQTFEELFAGYDQNPEEILSKLDDADGYQEMVLLKGMDFVSHCQHHIMPMLGVAHIAYIPDQKIVGISKIARLLDCFAKRLQTQETMTKQIADSLQTILKPKGVAVILNAKHQCMTTRGVNKSETSTVTSCFYGEFQNEPLKKQEFLSLIEQ